MRDQEIRVPDLSDFFNQIFRDCNFVVSILSGVLKGQGEIEALSREIATYVFTESKSDTMKGGNIKSENVKLWLESFIGTLQGAVIIDLSNEFQYYYKPPLREDTGNPLSSVNSEHKLSFCELTNSGKDQFREQLKNTIAMYENILMQQTLEKIDVTHTTKLLFSLKQQLMDYIKGQGVPLSVDEAKCIANINNESIQYKIMGKKHLGLHERKEKALDEIFHFYSKQPSMANGKKTFEILHDEKNLMVLGYFSKLLKDFGILLAANVYYKLFLHQ